MKAGRPEMVLGYNFFQKFKIFKNIFRKFQKYFFQNFQKKKKKKYRLKADNTKIIQFQFHDLTYTGYFSTVPIH